MRFLFYTIAISLLPAMLYAQGLTQKKADSLRLILKKTNPGMQRAEMLLQLAQFQIFKPGENQKDFDSANSYIKEVASINRSLKSPAIAGYQLLTESYMVREKGKEADARQMAEKAVSILETGNNKYYLGKAYFDLSNYYSFKDSMEAMTRIQLVQKSVTAFQASGHLEDMAFSLKMLGDLYAICREGTKAIEVLTQALKIYKSIGYKELQGVYDLLGRTHKNHYDDYKHALQYELLALKSAESARDSSMQLCAINNTLGTIYRDIGRKEIAAKYYGKALEIALKHNERHSIALTIYNISSCFNDIGHHQRALDFLEKLPAKALEHPGDFEKAYVVMAYIKSYLTAGRPERAKQYLPVLTVLAESEEIPREIRNVIYWTLASYHLSDHNFSQARSYLIKNKPFSENLPGSFKRIANDARLWYKLDSAQGNYRNAFYNLLSYKTLNDSLFNEIKSRQLQELEVAYETEKNEDALKSKTNEVMLLTQKTNLQQANLKQSNLIKNITIGGIILTLLMLGLLYYQFRLKQKSNKIISEKNGQLEQLVREKEWLLKEVHHRVKNNLQTIVSLLELQADTVNNDARDVLEASQNRIYATSLLHQKLYQDEDVSSVVMSNYIPELIHYLKESLSIDNQIRVEMAISPVELDISQAVPIGLIVNETISNAIKYAFKKPVREPVIKVSLGMLTDGRAELLVKDNGAGLPNAASRDYSGLGLKLVKGLTEDIDGEAIIESVEGTQIRIRFTPRMPLA